MIGGLFKSSSRVAMIAAAGLLSGGVAAQAADLGGNCCADLEERVAELESTTVRKGNTKVSVKLSGALTRDIVWHNSDADDAARPDKVTLSNDNGNDNASHFKITGSAQINADISVGFIMDFDVRGENNTVTTDDVYSWIKSNTFGTLKLGRVDGVLDGIHGFGRFGSSQGNLNDDAGMNAFTGSGYRYGVNNFDGDGTDELPSTVRYESPPLFGVLQIQASYSHFEDGVVADPNKQDTNDTWAVALRFAHEFGAFQVKAMAGFETVDRVGAGQDTDTFAISGGINHVPTGIYVAASYGQIESDEAVALLDESGWSVQIGIETKLNSLGKTNFYAFYGEYQDDGTANTYDATSGYGIGMTQAIDAAAMLVSLGISQYECADEAQFTCVDDATTVQFGSVINF